MDYEKIAWLSLDTLRTDCIPCNENKVYPKEYKIKVKLKKSRLDKICSKSCFFTNAISTAPYTSASHAAYFTGLWPKNNGIYDQFNSKLKTNTIFQTAKKAGYKTIFKTDFPFILGKYLNMTKGIDHYFIENDEKALELLKKKGKTFAFFHFGQIHYPYGFHNLKYGGEDYKKKVSELEKKYRIEKEKINLEDMAIETFRNKEDLGLLYRYKKIISFLYSERLDDDLFNLYLEGINYFNETKLNGFLEKLLGIIEDKDFLLIISSDHGEAWNKHTYGHHNSLDEGVIRVPINFYAKDIKAKACKNRIRTIDLAPTLNQTIFKENTKSDGKSLSNIIYENDIEEDREAFSAVWVNEAGEVIKNINRLLKDGQIKTKTNIGIKYSACIYQKNFKYIEDYKRFSNRSEKLADYKKESLYKIKNQTRFEKTRDKAIIGRMKTELGKYNEIKLQNRTSQKETIRKYFNLMGYRI